MTETNLWRMVERMEQLTEHIEEMNDYLDQVHDTHLAYNEWIQIATQNIITLQKEITFLKSKKTCI